MRLLLDTLTRESVQAVFDRIARVLTSIERRGEADIWTPQRLALRSEPPRTLSAERDHLIWFEPATRKLCVYDPGSGQVLKSTLFEPEEQTTTQIAPGSLNVALLGARLQASGSSFSVSESSWTNQGYIKFAARNSGGVRFETAQSPLGVAHTPALGGAGLTVGQTYALDYYLDCWPEVAGYVAGWVDTGKTWTQPARSAPVDETFVF